MIDPKHTKWQPYYSFHKHKIPAAVDDWLTDRGSLTQRLKSHCTHGCFSVEVIRQQYSYASLLDAKAMHIYPGLRIMIREVNLLCNDTPWVYARSIIPETSFHKQLKRLKFQGNKSLGATLFATPNMQRGPLEITRTDSGIGLWGRRSIFYILNKPILVAEYFLPELFNHFAQQTK